MIKHMIYACHRCERAQTPARKAMLERPHDVAVHQPLQHAELQRRRRAQHRARRLRHEQRPRAAHAAAVQVEQCPHHALGGGHVTQDLVHHWIMNTCMHAAAAAEQAQGRYAAAAAAAAAAARGEPARRQRWRAAAPNCERMARRILRSMHARLPATVMPAGCTHTLRVFCMRVPPPSAATHRDRSPCSGVFILNFVIRIGVT
jgi:hypothetical protein